ncbi:RNA-binding protein [Planomonospora parontospora subsp. parontospora]|uniref:RNA-binding protein n=3 Tax=Planomonospora parontospora TaxID=58119 RepID=A0AA37F5K0_9ACTN|nr:VCBS repeat-containing protein [Planomonospora parontospora]GGK76369.1 RNA-binding protein [Planomonospora parontospora]GII10140.1 RNA-binding protein [Planomonospora parontospora subsp. parontospora]
MRGRIKVRLAQFCAAALVIGGWQVARLPEASPATIASLTEDFSFERLPLNSAVTNRDIRTVAPAYEKINHWISSLGAAVALADFDANGRADDVCLVDPRDESVTLQPAPTTGARFTPVALEPSGLPYDATMAPMGCVPSDYNEDGRTDALVYYWGRSPVLFLGNAGPPTSPSFTRQELVQPYQIWNTNAVSLADLDGDGHTDIALGNYFPDGARVLDPEADQPELQMQDSMSAGYNAGRNRVLLFQGAQGGKTPQARFSEAAGAFTPEMANGWTLALGAQDLDADGLAELYVANDFGPDRLLHNISTPGKPRFRLMEGVRHFATPKSKVLGKDSFKGMGVAFSDLNQDDVPDMVVSNITEDYALHESNFAWVSTRKKVLGQDGTAFYDDRSEPLGISRSGWGWDMKTGDFAGDGQVQILQATGFIKGTSNRWPELQELAMTNDELLRNPHMWPHFGPGDDLSGDDPDRFFVRAPDGRFHDLSTRLGIDNRGPTRGMALADIDHDGRLDYAVANQWRQSFLHRNNRSTQHPFLGIQLVRPATCGGAPEAATAPAIGATALVRSGAAGARTAQVYPAAGHAGVSSPELLFALDDRTTAANVTVTWRDACGTRHDTDLSLAPGWHTVLLTTDGSAREITR